MLLFPFIVFLLRCSTVLSGQVIAAMFHSTFWAFWVSRNYIILGDIAPLMVCSPVQLHCKELEIAHVAKRLPALNMDAERKRINQSINQIKYLYSA